MARYELLTTWLLDAPIEPVFDVLHEAKRYPDWWRGVQDVEVLETCDEDGVGELDRFRWRGVLPYTLEFDLRVTRVEGPHVIEGSATGELEGVGTWRLFASPGTVAVVYDWRVRTTQAWMHVLGPVARRAFSWNHNLVMRQGAHGLARHLNATLAAHG